jgi:hypothetical protein
MTESTLLQLESIHERFPMISEEEKKVDVNLAIQLQSSPETSRVRIPQHIIFV